MIIPLLKEHRTHPWLYLRSRRSDKRPEAGLSLLRQTALVAAARRGETILTLDVITAAF